MFHLAALWENTLCHLYRAKSVSLNTDLPGSLFTPLGQVLNGTLQAPKFNIDLK